jgi:hypothetical protein
MESVKRQLRRQAESLLARADLALVRRSNFERWIESESPSVAPSPLPPGADEELRLDHPRLVELTERYRGHPATATSQWSDDYLRDNIDLRYFRGDNAWLWQRRARTLPLHYALVTFYLQRNDPLGVLEKLGEDGLFGAYTFDIDGLVVSRDLLDSVNELNFLEEELGIFGLPHPTFLDIGAGYGRLAHRATTVRDGVTYMCTDAVPVSTFICEYYLQFRNAGGSEVVPLNDVRSALAGRHIDVAVNVHSFSECPLSTITWWLDLLAENDVESLMIVPNDGDRLLSVEPSRSREDFLPVVQSRGFDLVVSRPKYAYSRFTQEHGLFPGHYLLFRRR